jgi:heme-degrading monooxygenase HmoA
VIVEYVRYRLPDEDRAAFERTYREVGPLLDASPHCLGWELRRSVEHPSDYVIRIEWDSQAGHEEGFRQSVDYPVFFGALSAFSASRLEMAHFERLQSSAGS